MIYTDENGNKFEGTLTPVKDLNRSEHWIKCESMMEKSKTKREKQGYVFTAKKMELYDIGYIDCYNGLLNNVLGR